jgi:4-diphosphocytidyl-2-C-methyl-D-erythritol kinase
MPDWTIPTPLRLFAPAKVNLALEVLKRRTDGYHEVVTVMESISIFDVIDIRPACGLTVISDSRINSDDDLICRALDRIQDTLGVQLCLEVSVSKSIPIAAGLGGGSSDAGTMIGTLGRVLGMQENTMFEIAASLGSDVPFFLSGGAALATGTGTELSKLVVSGRRWYVLALPDLQISGKTGTLYGSLDPSDFTGGAASREIANQLERSSKIDRSLMSNAFQRPLLGYPEFSNAIDAFNRAGYQKALASGAGPSIFAICDSYHEARHLSTTIRNAGFDTRIATSVARDVNESRVVPLLKC